MAKFMSIALLALLSVAGAVHVHEDKEELRGNKEELTGVKSFEFKYVSNPVTSFFGSVVGTNWGKTNTCLQEDTNLVQDAMNTAGNWFKSMVGAQATPTALNKLYTILKNDRATVTEVQDNPCDPRKGWKESTQEEAKETKENLQKLLDKDDSPEMKKAKADGETIQNIAESMTKSLKFFTEGKPPAANAGGAPPRASARKKPSEKKAGMKDNKLEEDGADAAADAPAQKAGIQPAVSAEKRKPSQDKAEKANTKAGGKDEAP